MGDDALAGNDSINISPACTCSGHRWIFVHRLSHALSQNMLKMGMVVKAMEFVVASISPHSLVTKLRSQAS